MTTRTTDFDSNNYCRRCDHCKMHVAQRGVVYCAKDGTTPDKLAIVSDKSADGCDRFKRRELASDRVAADMMLEDEIGEPRR